MKTINRSTRQNQPGKNGKRHLAGEQDTGKKGQRQPEQRHPGSEIEQPARGLSD